MQEHAEGPRSKAPIVCEHCGAKNSSTATACEKCEQPLRGPAAEQAKE